MWRFLLLSVVLGAAAIRARAQGAVRLGVGNQPCTAAPSGSGLPGDGLPFGCHADPAGPVPEVPEGVVPEPSAWFESFVLERQPLVLRGAVRGAPGVDGWTDDRLAGAEYGGLHVKLEGKREKRGETTAELVGKLAAGRDTLGHFVNRTRAWAAGAPTPQAEPRAAGADGLRQGSASAVGSSSLEGYVVSQLPDPMAADVLVPAVASCGSFARGLLEANLWVSSGNTSSMLHRDADNVLNCVYRGTKTWTLVDPGERASPPSPSPSPSLLRHRAAARAAVRANARVAARAAAGCSPRLCVQPHPGPRPYAASQGEVASAPCHRRPPASRPVVPDRPASPQCTPAGCRRRQSSRAKWAAWCWWTPTA